MMTPAIQMSPMKLILRYPTDFLKAVNTVGRSSPQINLQLVFPSTCRGWITLLRVDKKQICSINEILKGHLKKIKYLINVLQKK